MKTLRGWIQSVSDFFKEIKTETLKVSYPTQGEVMGSTMVVVVLTLVIALFLALMDALLMRLFQWVL